MVPTSFVPLESLPLTPNGKINRKALPSPESGQTGSRDEYEAPRTMLEELLVEVWQEVLQLKLVGIHDNFFNVGGHSLSATKMRATLSQILEHDIPLRLIFEHPTVGELATAIVDLYPETFGEETKDENLSL